jgi:hypothetical protein
MRRNKKFGIYHITKFVLLFFLIALFQSCATTSTSNTHIEGPEFRKNLPGFWEGYWHGPGRTGKKHINIVKLDGNKVHLTGFTARSDYSPDTKEVYGRIENSTLLLTWPLAGHNGVNDKYKMIKDGSNNLILNGIWRTSNFSGTSQLKKTE